VKRLFRILDRGPVLLLLLVASVAVLLGQTSKAVAVPPPLTQGWTQVVTGGFTDPGNSHSPFFAEFKGYLYLSTMASEAGQLYAGSHKLGGDIWRSSDGTDWEQIGTAGLGNPRNTMFDLVVFKDELYALSYNLNDHGMEIWVTSDGTEFTQVEEGGFGDPNSDHATPLVLDDRLILGLGNSQTGVQLWVSDNGRSFRQVVSGGLGVSGTTGMLREDAEGDGKGEGDAGSGGLSGWLLALIIALAVVAAAAIGVATYVIGKTRGWTGGGAMSPAATPTASPGFCSQCGSAVNPGSTYCPGCGRKL